MDPSRVDYVVCNHAEPDHAGSLPEVMKALPNATLVADAKCLAALAEHFDTSGWKTRTVADGETLSLGRRTLRFIETPMVHWPESMFTYVAEEKLLFSMDAFGQHYASSGRFDDEAPLATVLDEAKTYYANIVMPYGKQVARVLRTGGDSADRHDRSRPRRDLAEPHAGDSPGLRRLVGLPAGGQGRGDLRHDVGQHRPRWPRRSTRGRRSRASRPCLMGIRQSNLTRIATEMLDAATVAFGSSTLNRGMMPMAAAALAYLKGLRPDGQGRLRLRLLRLGRGRSGGDRRALWRR